MTIDTLSLIMITTMVLGAGGLALLVWDHHRTEQANKALEDAKTKRVENSLDELQALMAATTDATNQIATLTAEQIAALSDMQIAVRTTEQMAQLAKLSPTTFRFQTWNQSNLGMTLLDSSALVPSRTLYWSALKIRSRAFFGRLPAFYGRGGPVDEPEVRSKRANEA